MTLRWYGNEVMKAIEGDARRKVLTACLITERYIKDSMRAGGRTESGSAVLKPGTKRTVVDPKTGVKAGKINSYRSKPGEVPRVQTGSLRRSYTHEIHATLPIGRVGTNLKYAKWLEWGVSGGKVITPIRAMVLSWIQGGVRRFARRVVQGAIAPRPHVRPALQALKPTYRAIFGVSVGGVSRGG